MEGGIGARDWKLGGRLSGRHFVVIIIDEYRRRRGVYMI